MSKTIRFLFLVALLVGSASSVVLGVEPGRVRPARQPHATAQQVSTRKAHTPLERLFLPQIQKTVAAQKAKGMTTSSARPYASGIATSTVNFGGFLSAPYYPTHLDASCLTDPFNCGVAVAVTADFNKDGKPDVAVLQYDGTLNILLNNGSGGFAAPAATNNPNYSSTSIQQGFAVDINGDGYPDILAFDSSNNALIAYLNLKNGTFSTPITTNITYNYGSIGSIAVGDVNGDGYPDVVTIASNSTSPTSSTVTVQTYLGSGNGNFQTSTAAQTQSFPVAADVQFSGNLAVTLGDLNKDGKLDLAAELEEYTTSTTGVFVTTTALGNGDGTFGALNTTAPISAAFTAPPFFPFFVMSSAGVQITDLNNDGNPDVAIDVNALGNPAALIVALGNGSGGFTSTVQTPNVAASNQIAYADVNGDGIPDLVQSGNQLNVWIGKGDGTFTLPVNGNTYVQDSGGPQSLALADYNGDGSIDIAELGGDYKQLSIFAGNGKGSFYGAPMLSSTTDSSPVTPLDIELGTVADVQGKGFSSVLYMDYSGNSPDVVTGVGDGKGNFTYVTGLSATAAPTLGYIQPVQADFNGDGKQDLLMANIDGSVSVALSNGDGTFGNPLSLALPALDCEVNYATAGDVNGDGISDIVIAYPGDASCGGSGGTASGYFVVLGKGGGAFAAPVFNAYGSELYSVTIADMNGDGKPDLILDDAPFIGGTFSIDLMLGNGDGTFSAGSTVKSNYEISQVIAGDYNQDGKTDLILFSEGEQSDQDYDTTAGIILLPGNGDGTFGAAVQIGTGNFFLNGSLTDVNNDGIPDLVAALYNTIGQPNTYYGLSTLLGEGGGAFSSPVNTLESLDSVLPMPGSFYADNAPDFVVYTAYGTVLYLGQGGSTLALTASGGSITFGQAETLTATITPSMSNRPAPTGTVSFYDGTTLLSSVPLSGGTATLTTSTLAVGTQSITAIYSGDANFNPNTSATTSIVVAALPAAFTLTAPPVMNASKGQNGVATLSLSANATFSGSVSLTCSGVPQNASCTINPGTVTLTPGGTATVSLIFGTTAATSSANQPPAAPWGKSTGILSVAALLGVFVSRRSRRRLLYLVPATLLLFGVIAVTGCGSSSTPTVSAGSYNITITATPSGGSAATQTATIAVTVQ
jgi:hypothetical protein